MPCLVRERQANSADLWLRIFQEAGSVREGVTWPPDSWSAKNAQGRPLCVVVAWDAPTKAVIDAFLAHKALEAKWKSGSQAPMVDLRLMIVTTDGEKEDSMKSYAVNAGGRAWGKNEFLLSGAGTDKPAKIESASRALQAERPTP